MNKEVPLRRLVRIRNGGTPSPDPANWGGEVAWATPTDLAAVDGGRLISTARTLTRHGLRGGSATVPAGSLLMSTRAPIGYVGRVAAETAFSQGCRGLEPLPAIDPRFLQFWLSSQTANLQALGTGSTFQELSTEALAGVPVPAPTIAEQRRIADFLADQVARIDEAIRLRGKQASLVQTRVQTLLAEAVDEAAPRRRLASLLQMGAVGVVVNPSSYFAEEGVPFVHGYNVRDGWFDLKDLKRLSEQDSRLLARSRLQLGDVLVVRAGYPGRAAVVTDELVGGNCASVLLLRPGPQLLPRYLAAFLNAPQGKALVQASQYGAAQGVINLSDVAGFAIPLPSLREQQRRVDVLERRMSEASELSALIHRSRVLQVERKRALITAAVTGEFEVSSAGSRAAAVVTG